MGCTYFLPEFKFSRPDSRSLTPVLVMSGLCLLHGSSVGGRCLPLWFTSMIPLCSQWLLRKALLGWWWGTNLLPPLPSKPARPNKQPGGRVLKKQAVAWDLQLHLQFQGTGDRLPRHQTVPPRTGEGAQSYMCPGAVLSANRRL